MGNGSYPLFKVYLCLYIAFGNCAVRLHVPVAQAARGVVQYERLQSS